MVTTILKMFTTDTFSLAGSFTIPGFYRPLKVCFNVRLIANYLPSGFCLLIILDVFYKER